METFGVRNGVVFTRSQGLQNISTMAETWKVALTVRWGDLRQRTYPAPRDNTARSGRVISQAG